MKELYYLSKRQQIIAAKKEKTLIEEEMRFVEYCKTKMALKCDVFCHHPRYHWYEGESVTVKAEIVRINEFRRQHRHVTSQIIA